VYCGFVQFVLIQILNFKTPGNKNVLHFSNTDSEFINTQYLQ